ncbi:MAG TPA: subclass B1 metallo-beta-lactamase [Longimicrobiaceae bacterium]|nr:subclass B1 metallo-beta-lactamase [Longimicrobiaceae bacterium]
MTSWTELGEGVRVRPLTEGVWIHYTEKDGVGANGLVVTTDSGTVLVDTGWNGAQTRQILAWAAEQLKQPVTRAVVTHAHDDRMGGMDVLREVSIPTTALDRTAERARAQGWLQPDDLRPTTQEPFEVAGLEAFFPGPAHSPDNLVLWIPRRRVLFGGCMVKSAGARSLGFVGDAAVDRWPDATRRVLARYGNADWVVPGHGDPGGRDALENTLRLAEEARSASEAGESPGASPGFREAEPIVAALEQHRTEHGEYPDSLAQLSPQFTPTGVRPWARNGTDV